MLRKGLLLLAMLLLAGCSRPTRPYATPSLPGATPKPAPITAPTNATAPTSSPAAAATQSLISLSTAVPAAPTTRQDQHNLLAEAQLALAAYLPETDAQPVVSALLLGIADWLNGGGQPSDLEAILNEAPSPAQTGRAAVTSLDVTGDGHAEIMAYVPAPGLPLLAFVNDGCLPASYAGQSLPPDLEALRYDWPVEGTWRHKLAVQLGDLTGDRVPDVLFTTALSGASAYTLRPRAFQWYQGGFRLVFYADVVSWADVSDFSLEADPEGAGRQQFVLTYPHLYTNGFDHKMLLHPAGRQVWRWSEGAGRYLLAEEEVDLAHVFGEPGSPARTSDRLRWLTSEAEEAFRAGAYEQAVQCYEQVLSLAEAEGWQMEDSDPDWQTYAAFRRAETLLLMGRASSGLPAMQVVAEEMAGDPLGDLAQAFLQGYGDGSGEDAAARGVAAMQVVDLYGYFYNGAEGALFFPMDAHGILYPGAGLAAYLNAHPDLGGDLPALRAGLVEVGYPVEGITSTSGDDLQITLELPAVSDPIEEFGSWLLSGVGGVWRVLIPVQVWPTVGAFAP